MSYSSYFHGKQSPSILNKITYYRLHFYNSEFVIPLWWRYQVVLSYIPTPVWNTVKTCISWLLLHIIIQPLTPVWISKNIWYSTASYFKKRTKGCRSWDELVELSLHFQYCFYNFWRKHCLMTKLLMWYLFSRKVASKNLKTTSTCTFTYQIFESHYIVGYQVVQSCNCKE